MCVFKKSIFFLFFFWGGVGGGGWGISFYCCTRMTVVLAECPDDLQRALDMLKIYCEAWGLNINVRKTSHDIFKGEDQKNVKIQF